MPRSLALLVLVLSCAGYPCAALRPGQELVQGEDSTLQRYQQQLESRRKRCAFKTDYVSILGALLVPKLKLAFCYIPKNACTQFKDLFNGLNGFVLAPKGYGWPSSYLLSMGYKLGVNMKTVTKANGWKFATFLRDPALRYLSAWGSTCVSGPNRFGQEQFEHFQECCGPLVRGSAHNTSGLTRRFVLRALSDRKRGLVPQEQHWATQSEILRQCGWDKFKPESLDFLGRLEGDVNKQVKDMLHMVNAYSHDKVVDRLFPPGGHSGHQSVVSSRANMFFANHTVLEAVMDLYEEDYRLLPRAGEAFSSKL